MHLAALVYVLALAAILAIGAKSPHLSWSRALIAVFLLIWADLILTAQVLSLFSAINVTWAYICVSLIVAAAMAGGAELIGAAGFTLDYFEARHARTLAPIESGKDGPIRLLVAAKIGNTRLIDNIAV